MIVISTPLEFVEREAGKLQGLLENGRELLLEELIIDIAHIRLPTLENVMIARPLAQHFGPLLNRVLRHWACAKCELGLNPVGEIGTPQHTGALTLPKTWIGRGRLLCR